MVCACGTNPAPAVTDEAGAPDASTTDVTIPIDAGSDAQDAADAEDALVAADAADAPNADASAFCARIDAGTVLVCETFDDAGTVPLPFAVASDIAATVDVTNARALSPPKSARVTFTDAGDYNSATGAVAKAKFATALPRARLSFAVYLDGTYNGEVDVSALIWSDASTFYRRARRRSCSREATHAARRRRTRHP